MFTETLIVATWDKGRTTRPPVEDGARPAPRDDHPRNGLRVSPEARRGEEIRNRTRGGYGF